MSSLSLTHRLTRVAAGGMLYSVIGNGMIYLGQIIIARELTRTEYASFSVVVSLVSLFAMFADLGWTPLLVKRFAQTEEGSGLRGKLLGTALSTKLVLSMIAALAGVGVAAAFYGAQTAALVMIGMVTFFISSRLLVLRSVLESFVRAEGGMDKVLKLAALDATAFAALLVLWSTLDLTLTAAVAIYSLCHIPGFILLLRYVRQGMLAENISFQVDRPLLRDLFRSGLPLTLGMCMLTIHNMADTLILEALSTPYEVSAYAASFRLMAGLAFLPAVVAGVIMPEFVKLLRQGDRAKATRLTAFSLQALLSLAVFIGLLITSLAPYLVNILLGHQYADAWRLVILFGWMFLPVAFASFLLELGIAVDKQRMFGYYTSVLAAITVLGDLIVASTYGAQGVILVKFFAIMIGCIVLVKLSLSSEALREVLSAVQWKKNVISLLLPIALLAVSGVAGVPTAIAGIATAMLFVGWSVWSGLIDLDRINSILKIVRDR